MSNTKLIQSGHVWALAAFLVFVLVGIARQDRNAQGSDVQNSNSSSQNQNSNRNMNSKAAVNANTDASAASAATLSVQDRNFVMDAAMDGMAEVELGNLAVQRGSADAVKQFGKTMVDDHSAANTELAQLAATKGITLRATLDAKHQALVTKLSKLTGTAFDKTYSKEMLSDHTKAVSKFERQSTRGGDADLKAFAAKTLPTLKNHLEMAKSLNAKPAKPATTSTKTPTTP